MRFACKPFVTATAFALACSLLGCASTTTTQWPEAAPQDYTNVRISYEPITGIGDEPGVKRRDPSDIIQLGGRYYVFYTKVYPGPSYPEAYAKGTVFYASSEDGTNWTEHGEAIGLGEPGKFDDQAAFTPNVIRGGDGKVYVYYTGVRDNTPGGPTTWEFKDNPGHIGVAVSEGLNEDGTFKPFVRCNNGDPVIAAQTQAKQGIIDGWHVDDTVVFHRPGHELGEYWLYYKGHSIGGQYNGTGLNESETPMMLAVSDRPDGGFKRVQGQGPGGAHYLVRPGHELLIWRDGDQFATLPMGHYRPHTAGTDTDNDYMIHLSEDGLSFDVAVKRVVPGVRLGDGGLMAPGAFRPDLTDTNPAPKDRILRWGLCQTSYGRNTGLRRFVIHYGDEE